MFHGEKVGEWHRRLENTVIYSTYPKSHSARKGFEGNKLSLQGSEQEGS